MPCCSSSLEAVYSDGPKEQVANVEGALLIVPETGRTEDIRITNVPEDYAPISGKDQITSLVHLKADASKKQTIQFSKQNDGR